MKTTIRTLILIFIFFISIGIFLGCKKQVTEPDDQDPPAEEVNPNKPNANHLILNQKISGDLLKGSSLYKLIDAGDGGFFFSGRSDNNNIVGRLDQSGNITWSRRTAFSGADVRQIPANIGPISNALLVVGGYDANTDGYYDEGKIILCAGMDGTLLHELTLSSVGHDLDLNTVAMTSSSPDSCQFIGFGVSRTSGIYHPWAVRFTILNNGTIQRREDKHFTSMPWVVLGAAVEDLTLSTPRYFVKGERYLNDSTVSNIVVASFDDTLGVLWTQDIVHRSGFKTETLNGRGIVLTEGNIIVVGETDIEKEKNLPAGYWDAGLVASISSLGQVNWIKAVTLTAYGEVYSDCFVAAGALWITGVASDFMYSPSMRIFGYGLLSKIDLSTGNVLSNMTVGSDQFKCSFNSLVLRGGVAHCVGYTNSRLSGGGFQSWFSAIDVSNPPKPEAAQADTDSSNPSVHTVKKIIRDGYNRQGR